MRRSRRRLVVSLAVALATIATVLALWAAHVLRSTDLRTVDARYTVRGEHVAPDVVVVGIDARTNSIVGRYPSGARSTRA